MSKGNANKAKGTRAETEVVRFLGDHGIKAERRAMCGSHDQGDIKLLDRDVILEVKAGKQTQNYTRASFEEWMNQTLVEQWNAKSHMAALVISEYRRPVKDAKVFVKVEGKQGIRFMHLDEFAEFIRYGNLK